MVLKLRQGVRGCVLRAMPRWHARRNLRRTRDPIKKLIPQLCDPQATSLDVGASRGSYTDCIFAFSHDCVAFEPRPEACIELRQRYARVPSRVRVEEVALGDRNDTVCLRVPVDDPGRSTVAEANDLAEIDGGQIREIHVPLRRIDDYGFGDVGFIKIDAEGNEMAILQGAARLLAESRPNLVIEIEQRHHPDGVARVTEFLAPLGYAGSFYYEDEFHDIAQFNDDVHQRPPAGSRVDPNTYAHNFVFRAA